MFSCLAVGLGGVAIDLTRESGLGAGGALVLFTLVGTFLFIVVGGCYRAFYTAVFTGTYIGIEFIWSAISAKFMVLQKFSGKKSLVKTEALGAPIRRGLASPLRVATGGAANCGSGAGPRRWPAPANGTARDWFWT
jgi:hypothetical protein